jgi:Asp-tRNA(Asn)/Glu-tRNA(Gln) amidotransferase A subunit family amidase
MMAHTQPPSGLAIDRRTFLLAGLAIATGVAEPPGLETFTQWLHASRSTRTRALEACAERIRSLDASIQAWVQVLPQQPTGSGALSGIPFGVKDIIETKGLATEYGSPVYKGRIGTADAAIVRELRRRGGVLMGKTQSASFAYRTPPPTHNPRDLAHTPGGSSSGSAAGVAAGMVPIAIGTQTGGSVLRPASYCGVTGFKTSFGLLSLEGVLPFAKSLDTLGFFTHTAADMFAFWESMGYATGRAEDFALGVPDPLPDVEPAMAAAFGGALSRLRAAAVSIRPIDITGMLAKLYDAQRTVMFFEGARFHESRFREYRDRLADLANLVREGLRIPAAQYDEALQYINECKTRLTEQYKATPVMLVPAATGPAPLGLAFTGDSRMNAPWTALGTPAISIPIPVAAGLPMGLQLTADHGQDARVIRTAVRVEQQLNRGARVSAGGR